MYEGQTKSGAIEEDEPLLRVRGLEVAYGRKTILHGLDFDLPRQGVTTIMGPVGAGKSTLLRTLADHLKGLHGFDVEGSIVRSSAMRKGEPTLVAQSARLLMSTVFENVAVGLGNRASLTAGDQRVVVRKLFEERGLSHFAPLLDQGVVNLGLGAQRLVSVVRCVADDPPLLLIDEPTAGLEERERRALVELLRAEGKKRSVLMITHNRRDALELGGWLMLLADGHIRESRAVKEFFARPESGAGRLFVETGSCLGIPASQDELIVDVPPPRAPRPTGFHWIHRSKLAGMPRPGLLSDRDQDLRGLVQLDVDTVVCLEEEIPYPKEELEALGLELLHFPIDDMDAPPIEAGLALSRELEQRIGAGETVVVHCRAGLGRTGTILCALLILEGKSALEALEAVRSVQWRFVQSDAQIAFLEALDARLTNAPDEEGARTPHTEDGGKGMEPRCP